MNNAGVGLVGPLEGVSIATMQSVFDTNFFGAVRLVKAVLPGMKRRRRGHIVVVSSVMGLQGEARGPAARNSPLHPVRPSWVPGWHTDPGLLGACVSPDSSAKMDSEAQKGKALG